MKRCALPLINLWPSYEGGQVVAWVCNAFPTRGGSYSGRKPTRTEAERAGVAFLAEHGELAPIFETLADALSSLLGFNTRDVRL